MATDKLVDFDHVTDYISREAMHKANQDEWQGVYGFVDCDIFEDNENMIDRVPTADVVEVQHGRWEHNDDGYGCENLWWCSACKKEFVLIAGTPCDNDYYYCPNCGADMRM